MNPHGAICGSPGCHEPIVLFAQECRGHLAEALRQRGEFVPEDPVFERLFAIATHFASFALTGVPPRSLAPGAPRALWDLSVLVDPAAAWQATHMLLDAFGTTFADRFGYCSIAAPVQIDSRILLRLRMSGPAFDAFDGCLRDAASAMVLEILGWETDATCIAAPAKGDI